jgi:hypothetical protein
VPKHRLHGRQVHPRVEQVPRERAPAIMRREGCDPSALREITQPVVDRLVGEPPSRPAGPRPPGAGVAAQARSQAPVGCPAAPTRWRPRCQRRLHAGQCDIWRQPHSHVWVSCAVVYVHRQCSPCLPHASHRGTRVGLAIGVGIRIPTLGDALRPTRVSPACTRAPSRVREHHAPMDAVECRFSCERGGGAGRASIQCRNE